MLLYVNCLFFCLPANPGDPAEPDDGEPTEPELSELGSAPSRVAAERRSRSSGKDEFENSVPCCLVESQLADSLITV